MYVPIRGRERAAFYQNHSKKGLFIKTDMLSLLYTDRYDSNTSCCILFVNELKRGAKH